MVITYGEPIAIETMQTPVAFGEKEEEPTDTKTETEPEVGLVSTIEPEIEQDRQR